MAQNTWRDVNDPGFLQVAAKKESDWVQKKDTPQESPANPSDKESPTEYRITNVRLVEPAQGYEENKPFDIEGDVEIPAETVTMPRVMLFPIGIYKESKDIQYPNGIEAFIDADSQTFKATCPYLFTPHAFVEDRTKPEDATWKLIVLAQGKAAESSLESAIEIFPKESSFVTLKKGDYDIHWAHMYGEKESGESFKPKGTVKDLQQKLITAQFLASDRATGYFDDETEKALRSFQDYAGKADRLKKSVGKVEVTDATLAAIEAKGIVCKKTLDELDKWKQQNFIKPIPVLQVSDIDDKGVEAAKGLAGSDEYHMGDPVAEQQNLLSQVQAYSGAVDGWFGEKTKDSVTLFQEHAEKGEFLIEGKKTDIGKKLTGYRKGVLDVPTQEMLKEVVDKGGKTSKPKKPLFPLNFKPSLSFKDGSRQFGADRSGRKHAGCDLIAAVGSEVRAVSDGVVTLGPYKFAGGTSAIEVNHGDYIVRYTEIKNECPAAVKVGAEIKRGDIIGYVGEFATEHDGIKHMLHFELYSGKATGMLTDRTNNPYQRRSDLIDPTDFLENALLSD